MLHATGVFFFFLTVEEVELEAQCVVNLSVHVISSHGRKQSRYRGDHFPEKSQSYT